jgi:hypothetical protein
MISPDDLHLYRITDRAPEAVEEVLGFFRVYHSMRYVKRRLVIRLQEPLHPLLLDDIQQEFQDVLSEGQFTQQEQLDEEQDEPELNHLTRLVFSFNRRSYGRLRLLINAINRGSVV